jgi:ligand-binding SRPBCC domain-containing protein
MEVVTTSTVSASAEDVWRRVVTPDGINHELGPWMRMTMPRSLRGKTIDDVEAGQRLGRSWLLLFGVIPFDYDDLALAELERGRRFLERSTMLSMRRWEHERTVEPAGEDRCQVTDRVAFEPRRGVAWIPGSTRLTRVILTRLFAHRHRRLAAYFEG